LSRATLYQRILAEVLLQRTQADTVSRFLPNFVDRFPNWSSLAAAKPVEIENLIKPIGLWQRRARSLSALAIEMVSRNGRFPASRVEIEKLPGVGQYIANSILLFAHNRAEPLLDVNMARVVERLTRPRDLVDIRYDPHLQRESRRIVRGERAVMINWAILDLAALVCKPREPLCPACPLQRWCQHGKRK